MKRLLLALTLALLAQLAPAKDAVPLAADPVAEKRLLKLSEELRCLVCQNQNIADSHAELAEDLRREIRGMIQAGKTDQEITDFMVARYGDFVLYRPPLKATTVILWTGPVLLMIFGVLLLLRYLRKRNLQVTDDQPLTEADTSRADALLKENNLP